MAGASYGKPITLGGVAYISIAAACRELAPRLKISRRQLEVRIRRGWPEKYILHVGPMRGPGAWDHLGRHYRNAPEMCAAWGVKYATYRRRLYKGWSLEKALTYVKRRRRPTVDHTGRRFPTFRALCAAWGQPEKRVARRLVNGRSLKDALTAPPLKPWGSAPCTDHTGRQFSSRGAMCKAWGIAQGLVCNRIRCMGWSLERALTTPVRHPWGVNKED